MVQGSQKVGFVGFGAMARRMAARLRDASYDVVAFDPAHRGGNVDGFALTPSTRTLAERVDAVLVCVPTTVPFSSPCRTRAALSKDRNRASC